MLPMQLDPNKENKKKVSCLTMQICFVPVWLTSSQSLTIARVRVVVVLGSIWCRTCWACICWQCLKPSIGLMLLPAIRNEHEESVFIAVLCTVWAELVQHQWI